MYFKMWQGLKRHKNLMNCHKVETREIQPIMMLYHVLCFDVSGGEVGCWNILNLSSMDTVVLTFMALLYNARNLNIWNILGSESKCSFQSHARRKMKNIFFQGLIPVLAINPWLYYSANLLALYLACYLSSHLTMESIPQQKNILCFCFGLSVYFY